MADNLYDTGRDTNVPAPGPRYVYQQPAVPAAAPVPGGTWQPMDSGLSQGNQAWQPKNLPSITGPDEDQ